jgi:predicted Zn finger-like uncharacterized protein
MNVTCPQCASVFRVDPAKVPEQGVRARCSVCGGLIGVRRPAVNAPVIPPFDVPNAMAEVVAPAAPAATIAAPPPPPPPPVVELPATPMEPIAPSDVAVAETYVPVMPPSVPFAALPVEAPPPAAPTPPTFEAAPAPQAPAGRFANPFLQQDPATRARRLARALVSDLVVYHPEKRQRGLADGTLKELFSEEIRKSWEEYSEQVGEEIASTTPWFTEALNEILAEGRPLFG